MKISEKDKEFIEEHSIKDSDYDLFKIVRAVEVLPEKSFDLRKVVSFKHTKSFLEKKLTSTENRSIVGISLKDNSRFRIPKNVDAEILFGSSNYLNNYFSSPKTSIKNIYSISSDLQFFYSGFLYLVGHDVNLVLTLEKK